MVILTVQNGGLFLIVSKSHRRLVKVHISVHFSEIDIDILLRSIPVRTESSEKLLPDLSAEGSVQQAIQLLPYIPNILVKLGPQGVLSIRLSPKERETQDKTNSLRLHGSHADVLVRYYPGLKHRGVISVTGAG